MSEAGRTERSLAEAPWLAAGPLALLLRALSSDGEEARVIGGAVRNTLLGEEPGDFDIGTTAVPDEVLRRAAAAGFKTVPTGIEHGTITVLVDSKPFEVTTLREDVETFGRRARVRFGRDWRADAERRDFTINALSVAADGTIYDYVGGLADLDAGRVRFIGTAADRIAEDYLRILRFFRFHAAYGRGPLDPAGLHAAIGGREGLEQLSRERVRTELLKLFVARRAVEVVADMTDAGLLDAILSGVPDVYAFAGMAAAEAAIGVAADAVRRLAALNVLVVEDADRLGTRLRLSNGERSRLVSMGEGWWRLTRDTEERAARALLYRLGPDRFTDRVLLAWARSGAGTGDSAWQALATLPARWTAPRAPFRSAAFIARGLAPGPALGAALAAAEARWVDADFPADPAALDAIIAAAIAARAGR